MFADFLICVFSYNRGEFLQNLLDSVHEFYPDAHLALFDDGSDDPIVKNILNQLPIGTYVHITNRQEPECKHGGLYNMMNDAIEYAKGKSYKYAYFVQDDMQYLWRDEQLPQRLATIFSDESCLMCNNAFLQRIFRNDAHYRLPQSSKTKKFQFVNQGVADVGIIDLEKARKVDFYFPYHGEMKNAAYWYKKGYRMLWLPQPSVAWVPWPKVYRFRKYKDGKVHKLYPIKENQLERVKNNEGYIYLEDYSTTDRLLLKPYWLSANPGVINMLKIYTKFYLGMRLMKDAPDNSASNIHANT